MDARQRIGLVPDIDSPADHRIFSKQIEARFSCLTKRRETWFALYCSSRMAVLLVGIYAT
jgi:hypothetical protein